MIAYKATNEKGYCRDVKIIVGKTYTLKTPLKLCTSGFHFCENLLDVYNYYEKSEKTRIFQVEVLGEILKETDKGCTNKLKVIKELMSQEILHEWITKNNSGDWNSGNWNSGNRNSGNRNSGDWNSGYGNSGSGNSGNWNSGNRNSGNRNSGDWNSGYGNSGSGNSGDWNNGNNFSGYFCTDVPIFMFNKPTDIKWTQEFENKIRSLNVKPILTYIDTSNMTEEEKNNNPSHKITGGFLRKTTRMNWSQLTEKDKEYIKSLPNFDDDVFEKISGIQLTLPKTVRIIVNGVEKEIDYQVAKDLKLID